MAKEHRRSSEHFKYGMCLHDECSMCKSKTIQQVPMRKEFVCSECGSELRECAAPKKSNKTPFIAIGIIAITTLFGGGYFIFGNNHNENLEQVDSTAVPADTIAKVDSTIEEKLEIDSVVFPAEPNKEDNITPEPKTQQSQPKVSSNSGVLRLSYGTYTGTTKNGHPHGQGRLTYSSSRQINSNDMKGRTANPGDYVIGEFFNGFVVYGKHYDSSGNLIESLNFGIGSESSYDSK